MKKGFLIDMDGVLYKGKLMIPGANEFIEYLSNEGLPYLFLTNNSRSTQRDIALKLEQCLGVKVEEKNIFTSAMATAYFLSQQKKKGECLYFRRRWSDQIYV